MVTIKNIQFDFEYHIMNLAKNIYIYIMFINNSTKEFTLVNNAFPSHDVAFEHLL